MQYRWFAALLFLLPGCFIVLDGEEEEHDDGWDVSSDDVVEVIDAGTPCWDNPPPDWRRNPENGACENLGGNGGTTCDETSPRVPPPPVPFWAPCETDCNALDEDVCLATPGCRGNYAGADQRFEACWAVSPGGGAEGACEDLPAFYCSLRDDCGSWYEMVPGQFLACLPEGGRPTPQSCEGLDEATCIDYTDGCGGEAACAKLFCEPLYEGVGCDCAPDGCSCQDWVYVGCRSRQ